MSTLTPTFLAEQLELADLLLHGGETMIQPQDLPGRYGRVVKAIDSLLQASGSQAVLGGGWAVWRYGFVGRITQDVDIVLAANKIQEFLRVAAVAGFEVLSQATDRWPKLLHKETDIEVDILPEGRRPGTSARPAPTTIPHPATMGAAGTTLQYVELPSLIALKLAAGRARDESDVVELIRVNTELVDTISQHLASVHADYVAAFGRLVERAQEEGRIP